MRRSGCLWPWRSIQRYGIDGCSCDRAVFEWRMSKGMKGSRILRVVIGWKISRLPTRSKTKTNRSLCARFFPRFEQVASNYKKFWLVHRALCFCFDCLEKLLWFCYNHLKTAASKACIFRSGIAVTRTKLSRCSYFSFVSLGSCQFAASITSVCVWASSRREGQFVTDL